MGLKMKLIIGNKNYSSWSLRAWLLLSVNKIPFDEIRISLSTENTPSEIAKYSSSGKVPALLDNDLVIWDSLAICEYISEQHLGGRGWPVKTGKICYKGNNQELTILSRQDSAQ